MIRVNKDEKRIVELWLQDSDLQITVYPDDKPQYAVTTVHEPDVDLERYVVSPFFENIDKAYEWCKFMMEMFGVWVDYLIYYESLKEKEEIS